MRNCWKVALATLCVAVFATECAWSMTAREHEKCERVIDGVSGVSSLLPAIVNPPFTARNMGDMAIRLADIFEYVQLEFDEKKIGKAILADLEKTHELKEHERWKRSAMLMSAIALPYILAKQEQELARKFGWQMAFEFDTGNFSTFSSLRYFFRR